MSIKAKKRNRKQVNCVSCDPVISLRNKLEVETIDVELGLLLPCGIKRQDVIGAMPMEQRKSRRLALNVVEIRAEYYDKKR